MLSLKVGAAILLLQGVICTDYPSYEGIIVEDYVKEPKRLTSYIDCLKKIGPCTPLEQHISDRGSLIMADGCQHCTLREREIVSDLATLIGMKNPIDFYEILKVYDPESQNTEIFFDLILNAKSLINLPRLSGALLNAIWSLFDGTVNTLSKFLSKTVGRLI